MTTHEIFKRLRIGSALVVGFLVGKLCAGLMPHHASEAFIGGFGLGVVFTHGVYWMIDALSGGGRPE